MKKIISFMLAIFMSIAVLQAPLTVYADATNSPQEPVKVSVFRVEITDALNYQINRTATWTEYAHLETLLPTPSYVDMDKKSKCIWEVKLDNMTSENWRTLCEGVTFIQSAIWDKDFFSFDGPNVVSIKQQGNAMVAKLDVTRTVNFEVGQNGNIADKPSSIKQANGTPITLPPMPDNNHYFFTGWKDGNTIYKVGDTITLTKDLTLTAMWEKYNQFEVQYADGVEGSDIAVPSTKTYYTDETVLAEDMIESRENFDFTGWQDQYDNAYSAGNTIILTQNLTLTANWKEHDKFKVEYADGADDLEIDVPVTQEDYVNKSITVANGISRDNFDFTGWLGSNGTLYAVGSSIELTENLTLTANWIEHNKFKVEYADGADDLTIDVPTEQVDYVGKSIIVANGISRENFDFTGWKDNDEKSYKVGDKIILVKDLTLTAQWNEHKKFIVEYADGVDGVEIAVSQTQEDYIGKSITVANSINRDNFDFKGWLGSNGTLYAVGDTITLTQNLVLTAKWKEHEKFKVEYADGVDGLVIAVPATQEDYVNILITVASEISRENFDFTGWQDQYGNTYSVGATISLAQNLTLTAQWKRQPIKIDQIQVVLSHKRVSELAPGLWLVSEVHLEKARGFDYTIVKKIEKEWFINPKDVTFQNYDSKYSGITVLNTKLINRPVYPFNFNNPTIRVALKKDAPLYLNSKRTGSLLTIYLD